MATKKSGNGVVAVPPALEPAGVKLVGGEFPKMIYGPNGAQPIVKDPNEQAKWAKKGFKEDPDAA